MNLSTFITGLAIAIAILPCSAADYEGGSGPASANPSLTTAPAGTDPQTTIAPDNTEINRRDNATGTLTPEDQANTSEDVAIVSTIRKNITASDMSTLAKNVKIIAINGVVTLRGPVNTAAEKETIGQLAAAATGVQKVDNLLDVKGVSTPHSSTN